MPTRIPVKPFIDYKWRWAELTPSEGLNEPIRFLRVLRVLDSHQGEKKSSISIYNDLIQVEQDTNALLPSSVKLARSPERNLFRNSDRYWKALGLMDPTSTLVQLTPFGHRVAIGAITQNEFALTVVKSLTLPNRNIEPNVTEWERAELEIKPLQLILDILTALGEAYGDQRAYVTPFELTRIIIPLAGNRASIPEYVEVINDYRAGSTYITQFPDCTPESNDKRIAREFLLFLSLYGFCKLTKSTRNEFDKFTLIKDYAIETEEINLPIAATVEEIIQAVRNNPVIGEAERKRVLTEVLSRPQQSQFRKDILRQYNKQCLFTSETISTVLQACHIIPVKYRGTDTVSNGLCLRNDVHILYDTKNIRIRPDGAVFYSEQMLNSPSYRHLPQRLNIPTSVSEEALLWRWNNY